METKHILLIVGAVVVVLVGFYVIEQVTKSATPTPSVDDLTKTLGG